MKALATSFVVSALLGFSYAHAQGATVYPGASAPDLSIKRWLKGTPVTALPEHGIAIVEFWATWCGTCKPWYPRLSELARKHKDVSVIGVSIWEKDDPVIDKHVKEQGDQMDYCLAYSGERDGMAASWMAASGSNGIPTAFIVKDRIIQWIGHPMSLEKTLDEVIAGTYDVEKAKESFKKREAEAAKNIEIINATEKIDQQFWSGDHEGARNKLSEYKKDHPDLPIVGILSTSWLAVGKKGDFMAEIVKLLEKGDSESISDVINIFMRCVSHTQARANLHAAAKKILASYSDNGNALATAYNVFRIVKDKPNTKTSALKLLAIYKEMKLEPKYKSQLEADAKGE